MQLLFRILAIAGSAMFAGVMLAIGVILGAYWKSLPPAEFLDWFGQHSEGIKSAIPLVVVPSIIGLIGSLFCNWKVPMARYLWLSAGACIIAVLILTAAYFVPVNAAFASKAIPIVQVPAKLDNWLLVHNFRIALALAAAVLGVVAINR
ncbi:DUF1772 domain-containing protein [Serratia marcescens]|nr:DUF1772 domain-containing protein [Serratia marcescens]